METRRWRVNIGSWGAIAVGILGSAISLTFFETGGFLYMALFSIFGIGGALRLSGRAKLYSYLLPVMGFLAFFLSLARYLRDGLTTLTLALLLLTIVVFLRSLQGYRAYS